MVEEFPKDLFFHLSYFVDNAKTWSELMLVCKSAYSACDHRKEQKQWQFQPLYVSGQYSHYGFDWNYAKISEKFPSDLIREHDDVKGMARILIAGSVWGDGKYIVFKKPRIEVLRRLGISKI